MNLDPNQVLDMFAKSVNVSGYAGPIPQSLLARQDLEAEIVKLTNRQTPLRDIIKREKGEGRAHLWNVRTALGGLPANNNPLELFYPDGGLPTESDPIYVQKSSAYAYLGVTGVITGPMINFQGTDLAVIVKSRYIGGTLQEEAIPSQPRKLESA